MRKKTGPKRALPKMTAEVKAGYERAVAEEMAAKDENIAAARSIARRLKAERKGIVELVSRLREAREKAGISLNEMETQTGISKSSLSRLENSTGPNPTFLTLHRYAAAIGVAIEHRLVDVSPKRDADSSGSAPQSARMTNHNAS